MMNARTRNTGCTLLVTTILLTTACGGTARQAEAQTPPSAPPAGAPGARPTAAAVATPAPGGPTCATPDDSTGESISGTFRLGPETVYAAGAAALRDLGFAVLETVPLRELITAPSYAWPRGSERDGWHGPEHPGVEVFLSTRTYASPRASAATGSDSTTVTIGARALCRVAGPSGSQRDSEVGRNLEGLVTIGVMNALIDRLRTPRP